MTALFTVFIEKYLFLWTLKAQKAFENLKKNFKPAPILAEFNPKKETRLKADLLSYAAGGALL